MTSNWSVLGLVNEAVAYLAKKGIDAPRLDAEVLMARTLGWERIDLYLRHDQPLNEDEVDRFRELIRRRARREPVAYITGQKEFWSIRLQVTPEVLIPRPETETLVETALSAAHAVRPHKAEPVRILEIGTGSGAVAVVLALELGEAGELIATDRSTAALDVARANAGSLGVAGRIRFVAGDLFDALETDEDLFDLIVSNPPYIPSPLIPDLPPEIKDYEPQGSVDGGADGLSVIRPILQEAHRWLVPHGSLVLEVGEGQRPALDAILEQQGFWQGWRWVPDLHGSDRVLCVQTMSPSSPKEYLEGIGRG
jgi:release factor glutamine methyltransferase